MNLRSKLLLTIPLILSLNLLLGYFAISEHKKALNQANQIRDHAYGLVTSALSVQVHFKKQVQEWKNILLRGSDDRLYRKYLQQFYSEEQLTRDKTTLLIGQLELEQSAHQMAVAFLKAHQNLGEHYRDALGLLVKDEPRTIMLVDGRVRGIDRAPTDLIDDLVGSVNRYKDDKLVESAAELKQIETRILFTAFGLLTITVLIFLSLADRLIARPISLATSVARRISYGDLEGEIPKGGKDEAGQLLRALHTMQENLLMTQQALKEEKTHLAERVKERTRELNFAHDELARAAKAKDLFLAAMSHELRTPLTSVLGLTEMLSDQLYGPINENQKKALLTIDESARHLLTLINDILDVAKIESGKMQLNFDLVPVDQLVEASIRLVAASANQKQQSLHHEIDPRVNLVYGDSRRLKQVLVNLLANAVKFTPVKGSIGLVVVPGHEQKSVEMTVWDTGIGIQEGQLEKLFEPFVQLDNKLTRRHRGTGLGLTLVNRMATLHRGSVSVTSTPNKGSRFTLSLPWSEAHNDPKSFGLEPINNDEVQLTAAQLSQINILLAEDNDSNRIMTSEFLNHQGFNVITTMTGPQTLQRSQELKPDIILMDLQLEGMSGLDVTRELRSLPGFGRLPIVALTAHAMPGDKEQCLAAGMDDYISKPVGLKELHRLIINLLAQTHPLFTS